MIKNKIKDIIFSDDLTADEKEFYCHYEGGDTYDYGTYGSEWAFNSSYEEQECYAERIRNMVDDICYRGADWVLNLSNHESNRLDLAILRYLKTLTADSYTIDYINKKLA